MPSQRLSPDDQLDDVTMAYKNLLVELTKALRQIQPAYPDYQVSIHLEDTELTGSIKEIEKQIEMLVIRH